MTHTTLLTLLYSNGYSIACLSEPNLKNGVEPFTKARFYGTPEIVSKHAILPRKNTLNTMDLTLRLPLLSANNLLSAQMSSAFAGERTHNT